MVRDRATYSEGGRRGEDTRINKLVGVDDERRTRDGSGTRHEGRGLGNRNSENAAHRGQRQRGRDGGDHARGGEHGWVVNEKKKRTTKKEKPTSGLENVRMKVSNEGGGDEETEPYALGLYTRKAWYYGRHIVAHLCARCETRRAVRPHRALKRRQR